MLVLPQPPQDPPEHWSCLQFALTPQGEVQGDSFKLGRAVMKPDLFALRSSPTAGWAIDKGLMKDVLIITTTIIDRHSFLDTVDSNFQHRNILFHFLGGE